MLWCRSTVFGRSVVSIGCVLAGIVLSTSAWAANFPQKGKSIRIIVGFAAGGGSDVGARILAAGLEKELGTPVVVDNKPGAGGQRGYTELALAKPDGYTVGLVSIPSVILSYLDPVRKAAYNRKSFQLLALHVIDPGQIAVKADSRFLSVKDVVDAAKAAPRKITISTGGLHSGDHFAILKLQQMTGAEFAMVHFDGAGPSLTAILGGKIAVYCGNVGNLLAQVKSGDMRILGIMDKDESPFYPGVKTFEAQGYKLYNSSSRGFVAPAGTPKEIVDILSGAIKKVTATGEHQKKMVDMALTLRYMDSLQYSKYWDEEEKILAELLPLATEK